MPFLKTLKQDASLDFVPETVTISNIEKKTITNNMSTSYNVTDNGNVTSNTSVSTKTITRVYYNENQNFVDIPTDFPSSIGDQLFLLHAIADSSRRNEIIVTYQGKGEYKQTPVLVKDTILYVKNITNGTSIKLQQFLTYMKNNFKLKIIKLLIHSIFGFIPSIIYIILELNRGYFSFTSNSVLLLIIGGINLLFLLKELACVLLFRKTTMHKKDYSELEQEYFKIIRKIDA